MRRELDAYFTPPELAAACVTRLRSLITTSPSDILEPSAGGGAFVAAAAEAFPFADVLANDLRVRPALLRAISEADGSGRIVISTRGDFLAHARFEGGWGHARFEGGRGRPLFDLIIGNPPYAEAEAHVRRAQGLLRYGGRLAFLLRLGFLGGQARAAGLWRSSELEHVAPIAPRPSFTGGGTDSQEYALFVWRRGHTGGAHLAPPIVWRSSALLGLRGAA